MRSTCLTPSARPDLQSSRYRRGGHSIGVYLSRKQKRALALAVNQIYREIRADKKFGIFPSRTTNIYFRRRMYEAIDSMPSRWEAFRAWMWSKLMWVLFPL